MKILVADDNKDFTDILKIFLEKKGHTVTVATDGSEALGYIKSDVYDLAFVDHNMPEITGIELIKFAKKNAIRTKMIILTGYPSMRDFFAKSVGADGYLNKPCNLEDVEKIVNKYV